MADKLTPAQVYAQQETEARKQRQALIKKNREDRAAAKADRAKAQKRLDRQNNEEQPAAGQGGEGGE